MKGRQAAVPGADLPPPLCWTSGPLPWPGARSGGLARIERIEPGRIWFERGIGPFEVPEEVSAESETGWEVWIAAAPAEGKWHLLECGMVYP
ncbi:MAG TPA: hypothetical protein VE693_02555 [Gaiellaceae bacterium]|nr:hypothetical protein [Gaiellaceae bacterium]